MLPPHRSFTTTYTKIVNVLKTKIEIAAAFDPENTPDPEPFKEYKALWDTGATGTVVTAKVVNECGLKPIRITKVYTANDSHHSNVYKVNVRLPNNVGICDLSVTEGKLHDTDVLIGMDIIALGDFTITNDKRFTKLSFRCPSIGHIDFVEETNKNNAKMTKISRNALCPCGSGKKYKRCCGKTISL